MTFDRRDDGWLEEWLAWSDPDGPSLSVVDLVRGQSRHGAEVYGRALGLTRRVFEETEPYDSLQAMTARSSLRYQLRLLPGLLERLESTEAATLRLRDGSEEQGAAAEVALEAFDALYAAACDMEAALEALLDGETATVHSSAAPCPPLKAVDKVYDAAERKLAAFLGRPDRDTTPGLLVLGLTPGTGKTELMIRAAKKAQAAGVLVAFAVSNKAMLRGDNAELIARLKPNRINPVFVIVGRDETNCNNFAAVEVAMQHGYSPGRAVCMKCPWFPANTGPGGSCDYYQQRISGFRAQRASKMSDGALFPPMVATSHATLAASANGGNGRYGDLLSLFGLVFVDEDPVNAIRIEIFLSAAQCKFRGGNRGGTEGAERGAILFDTAIEIAKEARKQAAINGFCAPGSTIKNSHPIHTDFGTCYRGEQLHQLLQQAAYVLSQQYKGYTSLSRVLIDVENSAGFAVQPGTLLWAETIEDIVAMRIPPMSLRTMAAEIYGEIQFAEMKLRPELHRRVESKRVVARRGLFSPTTAKGFKVPEDLPLAHTCRLECIPANYDAFEGTGRKDDEWRFVHKEQRRLYAGTADVIVGDAYATLEHYAAMFPDRTVTFVEEIAVLHPGTQIIRMLMKGCSRYALERGGWQEVFGRIESFLIEHFLLGQRILLFGHLQFRDKAMAFLRGLAQRFGLTEDQYAFEHFWGGRGKDKYAGWEWTFIFSDPIASISATEHEANAQRFRSAKRCADTNQLSRMVDQAGRVTVAGVTHGLATALQNSDPAIVEEHQRNNVAELVQAANRSRPVRYPVTVVIMGMMGGSRDLTAQIAHNVAQLADDGSQVDVSLDQADHCAISSQWTDQTDCELAIRSVIDWLGVFSPWFLHAFAPPLGETSPVSYRSKFKTLGKFSFRDTSLIRRIWDPPADWQALKARQHVPRLVRDAVGTLDSRYASFTPSTWPSWASSLRGNKPRIHFDPLLCDVQTAMRLHSTIMQQYGPVTEVVEAVGTELVKVRKLVRPDFDPQLPPSLRAYTDDPPF